MAGPQLQRRHNVAPIMSAFVDASGRQEVHEAGATRVPELAFDDAGLLAWAKERRIIPAPPWGGVYFVACAGRIKIGVTNNMAERFSTYLTSCPQDPTLVLIVNGQRAEEKMFHKLFDKHWARGEWFFMTAELLTAIDQMRDRMWNEQRENYTVYAARKKALRAAGRER